MKNILLMILPYWTPLIPPQGISSLKSFLEKHGYRVRTMDPNVEIEFKQIYDHYFNTLKKYISKEKQGNFYNIGHNVLEDHLMAHINHTDLLAYRNLLKEIIYQTFFTGAADDFLDELIQIIKNFYTSLREYLSKALQENNPEIFGLTVYSHNLAASLYAFRLAKKEMPQITTVMGGGIFSDQFTADSPDFEYFLAKTEDCIDKVIIGEGQNLFLRFLQGELPKSKRIYTLADIAGEVVSLDEADLPDLSDLKMELYPYLGAYGSKSCPHQCSFCAATMFFGEYRQRKIDQVVLEMSELSKMYGKQIFFMCDSLLNPIITDLAKTLIRSDNFLYWDGYFRVDKQSADLENTLLWRRGGFYRARLGVESGSQKILNLMGKEITVAETKASLASLAEAGIKTTAYIVIGHPEETEEDFQKTLDLVEEMKDHIYQVECNPFLFYYNGQPASTEWEKKRTLLYPEEAREMLISQTWIVDCQPSRVESYHRLNRIVSFCDQLGIPNPYSISEIYAADQRWKKLHKNAVPPLIELEDPNLSITECKGVKKLSKIKNEGYSMANFNF